MTSSRPCTAAAAGHSSPSIYHPLLPSQQRKNSPAMFMTLLLRVDADLAAATRALPTGAGAGGAGSAARWSLNGGFDVIIVRRPNELDGALKELRTAAVHAGHTMGIDLEWRPDFQV